MPGTFYTGPDGEIHFMEDPARFYPTYSSKYDMWYGPDGKPIGSSRQPKHKHRHGQKHSRYNRLRSGPRVVFDFPIDQSMHYENELRRHLAMVENERARYEYHRQEQLGKMYEAKMRQRRADPAYAYDIRFDTRYKEKEAALKAEQEKFEAREKEFSATEKELRDQLRATQAQNETYGLRDQLNEARARAEQAEQALKEEEERKVKAEEDRKAKEATEAEAAAAAAAANATANEQASRNAPPSPNFHRYSSRYPPPPPQGPPSHAPRYNYPRSPPMPNYGAGFPPSPSPRGAMPRGYGRNFPDPFYSSRTSTPRTSTPRTSSATFGRSPPRRSSRPRHQAFYTFGTDGAPPFDPAVDGHCRAPGPGYGARRDPREDANGSLWPDDVEEA